MLGLVFLRVLFKSGFSFYCHNYTKIILMHDCLEQITSERKDIIGRDECTPGQKSNLRNPNPLGTTIPIDSKSLLLFYFRNVLAPI